MPLAFTVVGADAEVTAWCDLYDKIPNRCDFLVRYSSEASFFDGFAIVILSFLLAGALAHDFDEAITEHAVLVFRSRKLTTTHRRVVGSMGWAIFRLRAYILPFYVLGGVTSLIIFGPLTITKVLVDFLAIAFILDADDVLRAVFIHPEAGGSTDEVIEEMNTEGLRLSWFASRVFVVIQTIFLSTFILNIESYTDFIMQMYSAPVVIDAGKYELEIRSRLVIQRP